MLNKDYKEMLQLLLEEQVDFILVGAYALGAHGYPRATGDIDIWVKADEINSINIYKALEKFGTPVDQIKMNDFASEGIFLCGLAHSPKFIDENISQARAAAARAATVLSKTHLETGAEVSRVDQDKCISCMTCVRACPYGAPFVNYDHKAQIAAAKCMGCGICASECPARAIQLSNFESIQFNAMLDNLFRIREVSNQ